MRRGQSAGSDLHQLHRALARRVDQQLVEAAEGAPGPCLNRSSTSNCADQAVGRGVAAARARPAARLPSKPITCAPRAAQRQREVAQAAEQVGDALARLRVEQAHRARHQHAVHRVVDLRELGRAEGDAHAELRQLVVQLAAARGWNGCACPGRPAAARHGRRCSSANASQMRPRRPRVSGSRCGRPGPSASSPTATSICGRRSRIDSWSTSSRSGTISAEMRGGSTSHSRMSAT